MGCQITTLVGDRVVELRHPISHPFISHTIGIGWWDMLCALLRFPFDGELLVRVEVNTDNRDVREAVVRLERDPVDGGPG